MAPSSPFPLFLLGVGWSFTFVAGSALLTSSGTLAERARLRGASDALVWSVAVLSSVASGVVFDLLGYGLMALAGSAMAILLGLVVVADRRARRTAA